MIEGREQRLIQPSDISFSARVLSRAKEILEQQLRGWRIEPATVEFCAIKLRKQETPEVVAWVTYEPFPQALGPGRLIVWAGDATGGGSAGCGSSDVLADGAFNIRSLLQSVHSIGTSSPKDDPRTISI